MDRSRFRQIITSQYLSPKDSVILNPFLVQKKPPISDRRSNIYSLGKRQILHIYCSFEHLSYISYRIRLEVKCPQLSTMYIKTALHNVQSCFGGKVQRSSKRLRADLIPLPRFGTRSKYACYDIRSQSKTLSI